MCTIYGRQHIIAVALDAIFEQMCYRDGLLTVGTISILIIIGINQRYKISLKFHHTEVKDYVFL